MLKIESELLTVDYVESKYDTVVLSSANLRLDALQREIAINEQWPRDITRQIPVYTYGKPMQSSLNTEADSLLKSVVDGIMEQAPHTGLTLGGDSPYAPLCRTARVYGNSDEELASDEIIIHYLYRDPRSFPSLSFRIP